MTLHSWIYKYKSLPICSLYSISMIRIYKWTSINIIFALKCSEVKLLSSRNGRPGISKLHLSTSFKHFVGFHHSIHFIDVDMAAKINQNLISICTKLNICIIIGSGLTTHLFHIFNKVVEEAVRLSLRLWRESCIIIQRKQSSKQ